MYNELGMTITLMISIFAIALAAIFKIFGVI
jgi:hypothetical protein